MALKGSDGKLTSVLSYNGKQYLAADLVSEKLGLAYSYDSKAKTMYLGEKNSKGVTFNKNVDWKYDGRGNNPKGAVTTDKDLLSIGDNTLSMGMYTVNPMALSFGAPWYCPQLILNTDKKYQKITFKAGAEKSDNKAKILVVDGKASDGLVLKEISLTDNQFTDVELDIGENSTISIYAVGVDGNNYNEDKIVVGDIYLK